MNKKTKKTGKILIAFTGAIMIFNLGFSVAFANPNTKIFLSSPTLLGDGGGGSSQTGNENYNSNAKEGLKTSPAQAETSPAQEATSSAQAKTSPKQADNLDTNGPYVPLDMSAYSDFAQLSTTTPASMLDEFVGGLVANVKYVLGAIAVLYIMLAAIKLIILGDHEETVTKQKTAITVGIIGLTLVMMSDELAKVLSVACAPGEYNCAHGGFLSDPSNMIQQTALFKQATRVLITFIKYFIGSVAVLMLIRNGIRFIALSGNEESIGLDKKNVAFTSVGLILIIISSTIIDKVLYIVDIKSYPSSTGVAPAINVDKGIQELVGVTNLVVNFVAPIAILVLIIGAVMYATAGVNEEQTGKAKRLIILAISAMVLIYGAFAIISTVVSGQFIP